MPFAQATLVPSPCVRHTASLPHWQHRSPTGSTGSTKETGLVRHWPPQYLCHTRLPPAEAAGRNKPLDGLVWPERKLHLRPSLPSGDCGMDARVVRGWILLGSLLALGATYRTPNFVVTAPTPQLAREVAQAAEQYRRQLAQEWLGYTLPRWYRPCPIYVKVGPHLGAGGATSFYFDRGEVFGWRMTIQGSRERILDSVLPHEVTHTIFASHFRQPLPRWADEGACSTVEHPSERAKQQRMLIQFLRTGRGIAFSRMFLMKEYPRDVLPLYAQGHSLCTFLIQQGGKRKFIQYLEAGLQNENWPLVTRQFYGYPSLGALQQAWLDWVRRGSPALPSGPAEQPALLAQAQTPRGNQAAAAGTTRLPRPRPNLIYRAQSADPPATPAGSEPARVVTAGPLVPVAAAAGKLRSSVSRASASGKTSSGTALAGRWRAPRRAAEQAQAGADPQPMRFLPSTRAAYPGRQASAEAAPGQQAAPTGTARVPSKRTARTSQGWRAPRRR